MRIGAVVVLTAAAAGCATATAPALVPGAASDRRAVTLFRSHCLPHLVQGFRGHEESVVRVGDAEVVVQPSERTCEVMVPHGLERVPAALLDAVEQQISPDLTRLGFRRVKKDAAYPPVVAFAKSQPSGGCAVVAAIGAHNEGGGLLMLTAGVAPAPNLPTQIERPST